MSINHISDFIFKKIKSTPSHISFRILGIKFNCLKPSVKKERKYFSKYYQSFENATQIPKAEGNLRLIQQANLQLLKDFHKICTQNNLKYWIDFGTLLGAIRHKGFIPWDDDIDISMLRDDYEKLITLFKDGFSDYPDLAIEFENNLKSKCFVKITNKKSENLFLDVFPYDLYYSKLDEEGKSELSNKISELKKRRKYNPTNTDESMRANFAKDTVEILLENKSVDKNTQNAIFMGIDFPHSWKNKVFDWENIFPLQEIEFENTKILAPNMPAEILTRIYGNYMSIPKNSYPRHSSYTDLSEEEKIFLNEYIK